MKRTKINLRSLLIFCGIALVYSIIIGKLNNSRPVRRDLGAVLILGFFSGIIFLSGCVYMYYKLGKLSIGRGILGSLLLAPMLSFVLHFMIHLFLNLSHLSHPNYNVTLWVYILMLYFVANLICMLLMRYVLCKTQEKQERIDRITGKVKHD